MKLSIVITDIEARRGGDEAVLTIDISGGGEHAEIRKLTLASKMLFEIGNIGMGSLPYALTPEQFDTLEYDAKLWEAVKKGLDILSYGDNTQSALCVKLRQRGFGKFISEDAVEYIAKLGYINEVQILERVVDQLASVKLYGPSRIKNEIYKKGISREVVAAHFENCLEKIDFEENLLRLVRRKCDLDEISDRAYREKFYAAMYRLGYSPSQTRDAIKRIGEENEE